MKNNDHSPSKYQTEENQDNSSNKNQVRSFSLLRKKSKDNKSLLFIRRLMLD